VQPAAPALPAYPTACAPSRSLEGLDRQKLLPFFASRKPPPSFYQLKPRFLDRFTCHNGHQKQDKYLAQKTGFLSKISCDHLSKIV
jgi:hypothetical protein